MVRKDEPVPDGHGDEFFARLVFGFIDRLRGASSVSPLCFVLWKSAPKTTEDRDKLGNGRGPRRPGGRLRRLGGGLPLASGWLG